MKVVICVPTVHKPHKALLDSIEAAIPHLDAAGIEHQMVCEVGNPYISQARNAMLRKALDAKTDQIIFLDHDISFPADGLTRLVQTEGEVVAGTYRYKKDVEEYMGCLFNDKDMRPIVREDGCIHAEWIPAGFLRITETVVHKFMEAYPHLCYGKKYAPSVDLFNHGAHKGIWYGEDYAFSRNWNDAGGDIWLIPDIDINHHSEDAVYAGNFHNFMLRQPGGSEA